MRHRAGRTCGRARCDAAAPVARRGCAGDTGRACAGLAAEACCVSDGRGGFRARRRDAGASGWLRQRCECALWGPRGSGGTMASLSGNLHQYPPATSLDGELILVPTGYTVRAYHSATGTHAFTLSGHGAAVTAVVPHPKIKTHAYTCSLDGFIKFWDLTDQTIVKKWNVGARLQSMEISGREALLTATLRDGGAGRVMRYSLEDSKLLGTHRMRTTQPRTISASACDHANTETGADTQTVLPASRCAAAVDRATACIFDAAAGFSAGPARVHHTRPLTAVALSPSGTVAAVGDSSGRILLIHDVPKLLAHVPEFLARGGGPESASDGDSDGEGGVRAVRKQRRGVRVKPVVTTWHWHPAAVATLCFSTDGEYLLSGGQEEVLVIWQTKTGTRTYLPRLGGAVAHVAAVPAHPGRYLVSLRSNAVLLVDAAAMAVVSTVAGARPLPRALVDATPAMSDLGHGAVLLPAEHSAIQAYSVASDRALSVLQVGAKSAATPSDIDNLTAAYGKGFAQRVEPHVCRVATSADRSVMAVVDVRPDAGVHGERRYTLRLLLRSSQGGSVRYDVATEVPDPHEGGVTALAVSTDGRLCVTAGADGRLKSWCWRARRPAGGSPAAAGPEGGYWVCRSVGGLGGRAITAAALSSDASLCAVAAGRRVGLFTSDVAQGVDNSSPVDVLALPPSCKRSALVASLAIADVPRGATVVARVTGGGAGVVAWDALTGHVVRDVKANVSAFAVWPGAGQDAAAAYGGLPPFAAVVSANDGAQRKKEGGGVAGGSRPLLLVSDGTSAEPEVFEVARSDADGAPVGLVCVGGGKAGAPRSVVVVTRGGEIATTAGAGAPADGAAADEEANKDAEARQVPLEGLLAPARGAGDVEMGAAAGGGDAGERADVRALRVVRGVPSHGLPSIHTLCGQVLLGLSSKPTNTE
ncbi:unnamed protein product [Pedinophyceae sp. YPF-701]|nr:unnamed protein product [Pedinophyceae sp. YPF-701]